MCTLGPNEGRVSTFTPLCHFLFIIRDVIVIHEYFMSVFITCHLFTCSCFGASRSSRPFSKAPHFLSFSNNPALPEGNNTSPVQNDL